jgi:hypothetical protein
MLRWPLQGAIAFALVLMVVLASQARRSASTSLDSGACRSLRGGSYRVLECRLFLT